MELLLDLLDRCEKLDIRGWYRAKEELTALREAGEKMAEQLRAFKETADNEGWWDSHGDILVTFNKDMLWNDLDAATLAEWEAANK